MRKTLLYRLFGVGKIPKRVRPALRAEQILLLDEGIGGSITYRNYRDPVKRFGFRRMWFTGSLVVTKMRIAAFAYDRPIINLTFDPSHLGNIEVRMEAGSVLCVALDAQDFHPEQSGSIEFRFRTEKAEEFAGCFASSVYCEGSRRIAESAGSR